MNEATEATENPSTTEDVDAEEAVAAPSEDVPMGASPATGTYSGEGLRDVGAEADNEIDPSVLGGLPDPKESVEAAASGKALSTAGQTAAIDWFLATDEQIDEEAAENEKTLELNFGTADDEKWVRWTVRSVGMDTIRAIRKQASGTRSARRTGEADEHRVNCQILIVGSKDPDIMPALTKLAEDTGKPVDPVEFVKKRFKAKPGLIAQLAGEIMSLSGFDADDVREADQIEAAGNS